MSDFSLNERLDGLLHQVQQADPTERGITEVETGDRRKGATVDMRNAEIPRPPRSKTTSKIRPASASWNLPKFPLLEVIFDLGGRGISAFLIHGGGTLLTLSGLHLYDAHHRGALLLNLTGTFGENI